MQSRSLIECMTRAAARAPLHSSRLIRFLTENDMIDAATPNHDVGEQLGDWLHFRQAIALHKLLGQPARPASSTRRNVVMRREELHAHVHKVRAALEQSIVQGAAQGSGLSRIDMPLIEPGSAMDPKTAFEPYRRFLAAHQRQMDAVISTLRAQVRTQLSQLPAMQSLAALDAQFETILNERQALLLGKVTQWLEKRFVQALKKHLKKTAETKPADEASGALDADTDHWLTSLRQAMRAALLAELDTRMQPILGLLEAYNPETLP